MDLTIAYLTFREEPKFDWFASGLLREIGTIPSLVIGQNTQVIIVDGGLWRGADARRAQIAGIVNGRFPYEHVEPKPCVWQGPHRLTQHEYFAAANARNTAFALARGKHVAFADDLSVLMPGWLSGHYHAAEHGYVLCGMTTKHMNVSVDAHGMLAGFTPHPPGVDSRLRHVPPTGVVDCGADWLYGGTFSVPLEAALTVNGQDEMHDSIGGEDYDFGIRLGRAGFKVRINGSCGTIEDEMLHHTQTSMIRLDKPMPGPDGPYSSNVLLNRLQRSGDIWTMDKRFVLRNVRERVLSGEPFPIPTEPKTHWSDGQPLSEM